ncbi:cardiolipin synthase [Acidomonas methanolica]|uniref:cardiolipin synthase n=1 Tax=Acidomonas methanolica TaxID=437 RepID=UPI00211A961E|nr:cardiolipin synthase [Acidomonas methanolica]MCQ9154506.1 cardiolipin synthase [Acidomonas methanolica]
MPLQLSLSDLLLDALRLAIVLAVVVHVLRTKRDTAAATGWIGMVLLMPFAGLVLYLMFGVNRVQRRARRLAHKHGWSGRGALTGERFRVEGDFAPLARMVGRLTEWPLLRGNAVDVLHDGDEAYPAMLDAIAGATHSVLLCSYIFRADEVGMRFVTALAAARQRGVEVRVLVDGIGSGYLYSPVAQQLRRQGVACARFMHSVWPWRMPFINLRNHRKILTVDGRIGFVGGLNIGQENLLRRRSRQTVADTHFRLRGPVVHQLNEAFARDWSFTCGEELDGPLYFPAPDSAGDVPARVVASGPDNDLEKIEFTMLQAVALARRRITVMTPYFLPDERLVSALCLAAMRGVEIDIVAPETSNHRLIDWARDAHLQPFLDAGCRIWLGRRPFNHSKLLVVDGVWSFIGSANIDLRSLRLNFEINMEIYDTALATTLDTLIRSWPSARLTHHALDKRSLPVKLRNAAIRLFLPYL